MNCDFNYSQDPIVCSRCGYSREQKTIPLLPFHRTCDIQPARGIGDFLASVFAWIGFRKRRGCGCGTRQALLNRWIPFDRTVWKWRLFGWLYYFRERFRR